MSHKKVCLASDNWAPAHPSIMKAVVDANEGYASAYGSHFHLHVVPRKSGDTGILQYEPKASLYRPGSRAISPSKELQQTAELIRTNIITHIKLFPLPFFICVRCINIL